MIKASANLADLYEADETAWLDAMVELIRQGAHSELDYAHLEEYLSDMATRERREVKSRLIVLITHILKWVHQSNHRSKSWGRTIIEQRQEISDEIGRGVAAREEVSRDGASHHTSMSGDVDPGVPHRISGSRAD